MSTDEPSVLNLNSVLLFILKNSLFIVLSPKTITLFNVANSLIPTVKVLDNSMSVPVVCKL